MANLKGNSGCTITLIDNTVIRKQSKNIDYNKRLLKQIEKQKQFIHPTIKTPKVYEVGEKDNLIFFDMEYIKGQSFFDFCVLEKFTEIEKIVNTFFPKTTPKNTKNIYDILHFYNFSIMFFTMIHNKYSYLFHNIHIILFLRYQIVLLFF